MKTIRFILLALTSILLSGFMVSAYSGDGFSITESRDTENLHPWSTYASPANNDSRATSRGMHYRNYGMPPIVRIPPKYKYENRIAFGDDFEVYAFTVDATINTEDSNSSANTTDDRNNTPDSAKSEPVDSTPDAAIPTSEAPKAVEDKNDNSGIEYKN